MDRRRALGLIGAGLTTAAFPAIAKRPRKTPNFVIVLADDWSWPHASLAGDSVVNTPWFDRVASEGMHFSNAFVSSPSCAPSRAALLTGRYNWELEQAANMWGSFPKKFTCFPTILENKGYQIGFQGKGWSPGVIFLHGRMRNPAGRRFRSFGQFLRARKSNQPFYYWYGSRKPHRKYINGSGAANGIDPASVTVPAHLPDCEEVRNDIADYYLEVQQFDQQLGEVYRSLQSAGELDNTVIIVTSDNGMPFPRCKANLYDLGTRVPLCIRWPGVTQAGSCFGGLVSLVDIAPTILTALGDGEAKQLSGDSLLPVLDGSENPSLDTSFELTGRERHIAAQSESRAGYPMRSLRTKDFLYIRNFAPQRWPAGSPPEYRDVDRSPTKNYMLEHKDEPRVQQLYELAFGKRPAEELYDLRADPWQIHNIAQDTQHEKRKNAMRDIMEQRLTATGDPRVLGNGNVFDSYRYYMFKRVYQ